MLTFQFVVRTYTYMYTYRCTFDVNVLMTMCFSELIPMCMIPIFAAGSLMCDDNSTTGFVEVGVQCEVTCSLGAALLNSGTVVCQADELLNPNPLSSCRMLLHFMKFMKNILQYFCKPDLLQPLLARCRSTLRELFRATLTKLWASWRAQPSAI